MVFAITALNLLHLPCVGYFCFPVFKRKSKSILRFNYYISLWICVTDFTLIIDNSISFTPYFIIAVIKLIRHEIRFRYMSILCCRGYQ